jgi:hypothetical protein
MSTAEINVWDQFGCEFSWFHHGGKHCRKNYEVLSVQLSDKIRVINPNSFFIIIVWTTPEFLEGSV